MILRLLDPSMKCHLWLATLLMLFVLDYRIIPSNTLRCTLRLRDQWVLEWTQSQRTLGILYYPVLLRNQDCPFPRFMSWELSQRSRPFLGEVGALARNGVTDFLVVWKKFSHRSTNPYLGDAELLMMGKQTWMVVWMHPSQRQGHTFVSSLLQISSLAVDSFLLPESWMP